MTNKTEINAASGSLEITIDREFDAPVDLLFRAFNEPALLVQWLGPRDLTTTIDEYVPGHGGRYQFTQTAPDGGTHSFRGVFHTDATIEHGMVQTFEYLGFPGHLSLETNTFHDLGGGRSAVHTSSVFQSVADRDGMIAAGMEGGVVEGYERLDEIHDELSD